MGATTSRCAAADDRDPAPCEGAREAVTILDACGSGTAACVRHGARLLAGLDGGRVHPYAPAATAVDVYSRAGELPPRAWEVGR